MSYQVKIPSCAFGGVGSIEKVKEVIKKKNHRRWLCFLMKVSKQQDFLGF